MTEMLPDLARLPDPQGVFEEAIARGVLVYDPPCAINCVWHWICLGRDRRGNVWFRQGDTGHCLVMPPETPPDEHRQHARTQTEAERPEPVCPKAEGSQGARPVAIIPFPATPPDAIPPEGGRVS